MSSIARVQHATAEFFGVTVGALKSARQDAKAVRARHVAMWLCRMDLNETYEVIGRHFGRRDHSTVMHAVNKIQRELGR